MRKLRLNELSKFLELFSGGTGSLNQPFLMPKTSTSHLATLPPLPSGVSGNGMKLTVFPMLQELVEGPTRGHSKPGCHLPELHSDTPQPRAWALGLPQTKVSGPG
ncbi:hypothetical protein H1C71_017485 [Ictidomys tridecemlineatus]|nr:hypothetical protein H1C71_017485 [Ictidomys tridecemlineatus]